MDGLPLNGGPVVGRETTFFRGTLPQHLPLGLKINKHDVAFRTINKVWKPEFRIMYPRVKAIEFLTPDL